MHKLLFLCTGNSCRSQIAEGLCRHILGEEVEVYSAGIESQGLNPLAVEVMAEVGIDISNHHSKTLDAFIDSDFDLVITVCGHADKNCLVFPSKTRLLHHGFDDPPALAQAAANEDQVLVHYHRVWDEIKGFVKNASLGTERHLVKLLSRVVLARRPV